MRKQRVLVLLDQRSKTGHRLSFPPFALSVPSALMLNDTPT
jgi:hypothetical protein